MLKNFGSNIYVRCSVALTFVENSCARQAALLAVSNSTARTAASVTTQECARPWTFCYRIVMLSRSPAICAGSQPRQCMPCRAGSSIQSLASTSCTASLRSHRGGRVIAESGEQSCDIAAAPSRRAGLASVMHMSVHCTHSFCHCPHLCGLSFLQELGAPSNLRHRRLTPT